MSFFMRCAAVLLLIAIAAPEADARSAAATAQSSARKRGYTAEQTRCFVPVFVSYAAQDRWGRWVAGGRSKRGDVYRHEVYAKCGVMR